MISVLSKERTLPAYDLLASLGLPEVTNARMLGWAPSRFANPGDVIYLISEKGQDSNLTFPDFQESVF